jgi:predicted nucleotidyltransferase
LNYDILKERFERYRKITKFNKYSVELILDKQVRGLTYDEIIEYIIELRGYYAECLNKMGINIKYGTKLLEVLHNDFKTQFDKIGYMSKITNFAIKYKRSITMNTGIKPIVLDEIRALAHKYHVKKVILFGSRARGDFKRTSDIDIAVDGGDFVRFAIDIDEETSTLLEFDVVNLQRDMQEELRKSIDTEGRIIYEEV